MFIRSDGCKPLTLYTRRPTYSFVKQLNLDQFHKVRHAFGGDLLKPNTNPKIKRPLDSKLPIHLVLKAKRSLMRLPKHFANVDQIVHAVAGKHGVRIYEYANVGNHLHVLIKISRRPRWAAFIRELTGRLATLLGGNGIWAKRPFTRVVNGWRKAFRSVKRYVGLNAIEADGGILRADARDLRYLHHIWRSDGGPFDRAA